MFHDDFFWCLFWKLFNHMVNKEKNNFYNVFVAILGEIKILQKTSQDVTIYQTGSLLVSRTVGGSGYFR